MSTAPAAARASHQGAGAPAPTPYDIPHTIGVDA